MYAWFDAYWQDAAAMRALVVGMRWELVVLLCVGVLARDGACWL